MYNIITYGKVYYSNREKTIEIESAKSQFKSLGSLITDKVIIEKKDVPINYYIEKNYKKDSRNENILFDPSGDAKFKRDLLCLNDYLRNVGLELLAQVRKFHPYGKIEISPKNKCIR